MKRVMKAAEFSRRLIRWHSENGRKDLPWQKNRTAYRVWISEIMLQQTQVATVIPYYQRFMRAFPNVKILAQAELDEVLSLWSGLGYYRRARYLHQAARRIVEAFGGRFPKDIETLQSLPGIGRSTAGALLALAHNRPMPILDGNVKRVLCRFHGIETWPGDKAVETGLWEHASAYVQASRDPATFTQAIMDLGATLCTRRQPDCPHCPFRRHCLANQHNLQERIPAAKEKKILPVRRTSMLLLHAGENILLMKRPPTGVWPGLWSLPEGRGRHGLAQWCRQYGMRVSRWQALTEFRHTFSHYHLDIEPWMARFTGDHRQVMAQDQLQWLPRQNTHHHGIPAPVLRLIKHWEKQWQENLLN